MRNHQLFSLSDLESFLNEQAARHENETHAAQPQPQPQAAAHRTRNGNASRPVPRVQGGITQPQMDYIVDLLHDKDIAGNAKFAQAARDEGRTIEEQRDFYIGELRQVTKSHASKVIEALRALPRKPRTEQTHTPDGTRRYWEIKEHQAAEGERGRSFAMHKGDRIVPRGSYALRTPGKNHVNDITFYSVWISDDGTRWSVKQLVGPERVRMQRTAQAMVLDQIAKNPAEAASLYGHEIGRCGICSRRLTNDISRERGIGPICAARWGW